ncbi:MAG: hypothetical protein QNJ05_02125 [Woeseiaceae bacterium]|nr:hypothetical protein [Woeseiaceae bacterium]
MLPTAGEKAIRFDPITLRFQAIRWSAIIAGIGLPALAWLIAAEVLELKLNTAIGVTLAVIIVAVVMLKLVSNYLMNGFMRAYMDAGNWDYLLARFGVARLPTEFRHAKRHAGVGQLDRDDVVFAMEIQVLETGFSVNIQPFGRIVVPWQSVQMLTRRRLKTDRGQRDVVSVIIDGPESFLSIPWSIELDSLVPRSVGISAGTF